MVTWKSNPLTCLRKSQHSNAGFFTRHTSSCMCVGCLRSPESLTGVNSSGFTQLPPSCNSNYIGYIFPISYLTTA
ncbi:hypothetical protein EFV59_10050 [Yersinia enterocolitica]|nr:hypothetical protein [Yersinia enterocolitica]